MCTVNNLKISMQYECMRRNFCRSFSIYCGYQANIIIISIIIIFKIRYIENKLYFTHSHGNKEKKFS